MYGVFINGKRPRFKKDLAAACAQFAGSVRLEGTSHFGNEYSGPLTEAPNARFTIVGPDPYTSRKWYATIEKTGQLISVR